MGSDAADSARVTPTGQPNVVTAHDGLLEAADNLTDTVSAYMLGVVKGDVVAQAQGTYEKARREVIRKPKPLANLTLFLVDDGTVRWEASDG